MKCPTPDKPRYADRLAALLAAEEHVQRYPEQTDDREVYRCPSRKHWHIRHKRAPAWRRAIRRARRSAA